MANEFINDGKFIFLNVPYAEIYIPNDLFLSPLKDPSAKTLAFFTGEELQVIGIFYMRLFTSEEQSRDKATLKTFNYPNIIECRPSGKTTKEVLEFNGVSDIYRVYRLYQGDIIMDAVSQQSSSNIELFTSLILSGKIPSSLSYDDIYFAWLKNYEINGVTPAIPHVLMQAIVARLCRAKNNPDVQFRMLIGAGKAGPRDYQMININQSSQHSSVMGALSFERFAESLTTSLYMSKTDAPQEVSPLEMVITI